MENTRPSTVWVNGIKPCVGDTATSKSVGRSGRAIHVWEACPSCGFERWIKRNTSGIRCKSCALRYHSMGKSNHRWNPTRRTATKSGFRVYVTPDHPFFCMAHRCSRGYAILEHRLIMAEHLDRPLSIGEVIHHIDGDNLNNNISNLLLLSSQAHHSAYTLLQTQINRLEKSLSQVRGKLILLDAENEMLRFQLSTKGTGNPELAGDDESSLGKCRDFTPPILNYEQDKEKVHSSGKLGGESA